MATSTPKITLKWGEARTLTYTIKDRDTGDVIDVSTATAWDLDVKKSLNDPAASILIAKNTADFDTTDAATGIVKVTLTSTNLTLPPKETYKMQLQITFSVNSIIKIITDLEIGQAM